MLRRRRSRSFRSVSPRGTGRQKFWIGYSGSLVSTVSGVPTSVTLLDPRVFEPGGQGSTYGKDTSQSIMTLLRMRWESVTTMSVGTVNASIADCYFGFYQGEIVAPPYSPSLGTKADAQEDWLDLWQDCVPFTTFSSFTQRSTNGVISRDIRTKRRFQMGNRSFLQFNQVFFPHSGLTGTGPNMTTQFLVRMLVSSA